MTRCGCLARENSGEQPPANVCTFKSAQRTNGGDDDSWPIQLSPAGDRGRCGQTALDAGRRGPAAGRRPQPGADDEAPARDARASGRSARHRRPEGHPPRRQQDRDRRDDHPARTAGVRRDRKIAADPARDRAFDRRSAGALLRHHRRQRRQWRSRQRHAGADDDAGRELPARRDRRRARRRGVRILSGRLFHRARARRNPDLDLDSRAGGRSRLRLRETEAQGRRLRHRGGGRRADHGRRQGRDLRDRPDQSARNAAARRRRGQGRDRNQPRCGDAEEGRRRGGGDHVAGRGCARPGRIPQACRRHHGDAGAARAPPARAS